MSTFNISEELKKVPESPGVYLMHDSSDKIIYIGKAKNLKHRVSQYFGSGKKHGPKIERMVKLISYFDYIVTDSEVEALVLENNLIKEHRPRYNTLLKDDKTYPYIKLTLNEAYPRLILTRKVKKDEAKYFGPYPDAAACRQIINLLNRTYKLKTCSRNLPRDIGKERPCLNSHIGRCQAPCKGGVSMEEYAGCIREVRRVLSGNFEGLIKSLRDKMEEASLNMEYEKAAEIKELKAAAEAISGVQKMELLGEENRDVLGLFRDDTEAVIVLFFVRGGKLIGSKHFNLALAFKEDDGNVIASFIKQFYSASPAVPRLILLPHETEDVSAVSDWLKSLSGHKVEIAVPRQNDKARMVNLACRNAKLIFERNHEKVKLEELGTLGAVKEISKILGINYAKRMESYDISNISGSDSVASMVVFEDGKPKKSDYRKFKIKTVEGSNDPASMAEVIRRRFSHEWNTPDLLLIDGGKTQVNAVLGVLKDIDVEIPVCGMVKDDRHRTRGLIFEGREIALDKSKEPFKLITRIQDETHRFAIEYHKLLRSKGQVKSILDEIEGVGPKRRLALIRHFKTLDAIKKASASELSKVPGMNKACAKAVSEFFSEHGAS